MSTEPKSTPARLFGKLRTAIKANDAETLTPDEKAADVKADLVSNPVHSIALSAPLRTAYLAGLGVILAVVTIEMLQRGSTVLVYIGLALFLALGLDPIVSFVERKVPRGGAVAVVFLALLIIIGLVLWAIVPVIVEQITYLTTHFGSIVKSIVNSGFGQWVQEVFKGQFNVNELISNAQKFAKDPSNIVSVGGGLLSVGAGIASGLSGTIIVLILTLYFLISLGSMKAAFVRCFPAFRREATAILTEDISRAVGRYVMGQASLAAINGILSFIMLSIVRAPFPALLAMIAFLFSLLPLVGTLSGSVIITIVSLFGGHVTAIIVGIYYLVYMQIEAYVLSPRIMNKAVSVPGALVVIAAAGGGALGGVLGALVAIPIAASILIIIQKVLFPAQDLKTVPPKQPGNPDDQQPSSGFAGDADKDIKAKGAALDAKVSAAANTSANKDD